MPCEFKYIYWAATATMRALSIRCRPAKPAKIVRCASVRDKPVMVPKKKKRQTRNGPKSPPTTCPQPIRAPVPKKQARMGYAAARRGAKPTAMRNPRRLAVSSGSPIQHRMRKIGSREPLFLLPAGAACECGEPATRRENAYSYDFSLQPAKRSQVSSAGSCACKFFKRRSR